MTRRELLAAARYAEKRFSEHVCVCIECKGVIGSAWGERDRWEKQLCAGGRVALSQRDYADEQIEGVSA